MKQATKLVDWRRDRLNRFIGDVYGHPNPILGDGERVRTTPMQRQWRENHRLLAVTRNTLYELCQPDGAPWFDEAKVQQMAKEGGR